MSTLAENLIAAVKGVAALAGAGCVALLGALYAFQRKLIFAGHAMDIGPALPIRKGRKIEVDVSNESKPRGAPDTLVGVYFPPTKPNAKTLAFWHGNADQLGNVADFLGQALQQRLGVGFLGIEYPGYALCTSGEPTETTIHWTSQRMLRHLRETLKTPARDTVAFGQSIGGAVALKAAHDNLVGSCVLLSSFESIPAMAKALFPFIPVPALLVKDPFDNAKLAPSVNVPVLCLHGTRDEIVPFAQGRAICDLLPSSEFVSLPNCGHNDTFNGAAYRLIVDSLAAFLEGAARWGGGRVLGEG